MEQRDVQHDANSGMVSDFQSRLKRISQPALLGLGFVILVAINATSLWLVTRAQTGYGQIAHTLAVENQLSNLLLALRRAESAQRGYLLTQSPDFLLDYEEAVSSLPRLIADIRTRTADNPTQQNRIADIEAPVQRRMAELNDVIATAKFGGTSAAAGKMLEGGGRRNMETVRDLVEEMIDEESLLLRQRTEAIDSTIFNLFAVSLVGSLLIVGLGLAAILLVRRSSRERDEAQKKLSSANMDLEQSIAERTAELEEANQELQRYAYIVSHDLRSPLVNIMGFTTELESLRDEIFTELAARQRSSGEQLHSDEELKQSYEEALRFIKASISKMDALIHAILRLSREGQRQFRPERLNMTAMFNGIAASIAHQIETAGATIELEPLPDIDSDKVAVEQIFSNLIDNAVKYLDPSRPGRIVVRGRRVLSHIVYEVEDNGRGIPEKDHRRIFDLFRRSGAQDRPGEGIGLAHVRALVRRLGGRITVKSKEGDGSTFVVTLPRLWLLPTERNAA